MGLLILIIPYTMSAVQLKANYVATANTDWGFPLPVSLHRQFIYQPVQMSS